MFTPNFYKGKSYVYTGAEYELIADCYYIIFTSNDDSDLLSKNLTSKDDIKNYLQKTGLLGYTDYLSKTYNPSTTPVPDIEDVYFRRALENNNEIFNTNYTLTFYKALPSNDYVNTGKFICDNFTNDYYLSGSLFSIPNYVWSYRTDQTGVTFANITNISILRNGSSDAYVNTNLVVKVNDYYRLYCIRIHANGYYELFVSSSYVLETYRIFNAIEPSPPPSTDPFEPGGTSKPDGGGGTFDGESDPVEVPDLPTVTAAKSGLLNLFNPTIGEINSISNFLWSTDWKDWITRLGSKPLEFILGLSIVPWKPRISTAISLHLGPLDTEVVTHPLSTQYEELDFGSIDIEEYWGAVLDYSPYTSIDIFLPYIGSVSLDVDEVMGKTLHCIYHCDSLSGQVVAMLKSSDAILYQFEGNAAQNIPMTATDYTSVILGYGAAAVGLIALAAPAVVGATGAAGAGGVATAASSAALPAVSSAQIAGIGSTIAGVMTAKPHAHHTGNATGAGSQLGIQQPYLVIKRARQSLPENYNKISGYPSNIYAQVSSLSGFTVFENIRLDGVPAMDDELAEIYQYMITGVIV